MKDARPVWAWIAHRDGRWASILANAGPKRSIARDLAKCAADGLTITPVYDRDEYNTLLASLKPWKAERRAT